MQSFRSFIQRFYDYSDDDGYTFQSVEESDPKFSFLQKLKKGNVYPSDVVAYATFVKELLPTIRLRGPVDPMRRAGRDAYTRTSVVDYQIKPGDSKEERFQKNIMRFGDELGLPLAERDILNALASSADHRILNVTPIGLYVGYKYSNMFDDGETKEQVDDGETKEQVDDGDIEDLFEEDDGDIEDLFEEDDDDDDDGDYDFEL
jgi:hypothetical protein